MPTRLKRKARESLSSLLRVVSKVPGLITSPARVRRAVVRRIDPRVTAWERQIEEAYGAESWTRVVELVRTVVQLSGAIDSPGLRLKAVHAHVRLRQFSDAELQLGAALDRYPGSDVLLKAQAEHLMMVREFGGALMCWQRATAAKPAVVNGRVRSFPTRGEIFDWYELAWIHCAEHWDELWSAQGAQPTVGMYQMTIQTLVGAGERGLAKKLSLAALKTYPESGSLAIQASETLVLNSPDSGTGELITQLVSANNSQTADVVARDLDEAQLVLREIRELGPTPLNELRVLTAYRSSGADFAIRTSNYWDEERIHSEALRLAKRDHWPEQTAETDLVSAKAWDEALRFASSRAESVGVSTNALARAVFHFFKQEIVQKIPVDRIADELARTRGAEPVLLELDSLALPYMVSYPTGRMQVIYFYEALRRRGCNVTLVYLRRRPSARSRLAGLRPPEMTQMPTVSLVPQPAQLRPPVRRNAPIEGHPGAIVVPAGIRSVSQVLSRLGAAIVVNSGSAVKGLAYDRSLRQEWDYDVNLSLHRAGRSLLPSLRIPTVAWRTWRRCASGLEGSPAAPTSNEAVDAFLSIGKWEVVDWHSWLERAIVPYFKELVKQARVTLDEYAVMDAHIGDYLYAEPSLVAACVKERGGRVHLWPHSTNPVHVEFHDQEAIDSVHSVTKSGAQVWKTALPNVRVRHDAGLMLSPPAATVPFVSGQPLSIVVVGGRPIMRNLPILDIAAHEDLYRRFFGSLESFVQAGKVRVYFKPRGRTGEHETWLERVVGRASSWERVLEHPLRISLDNPVFVSLSVGSSALLEGVTRGIPGLIVREGFARDYLATEEGIFETSDVSGAVDALSRLSEGSNWEVARDRQVASLSRELEPGHAGNWL